MSKVKIYSKYDVPPRCPAPLESGSDVDKESHIFTDINYIVKRYVDTDGISGMPARVGYNKPIYGDFSKSYTLADVCYLRENMQVLFDELPSDERKKYKSFKDFLTVVGTSDDDALVKMFNLDSSTSSPVTAPVNTGAEASGSVQVSSSVASSSVSTNETAS